MPNYPIIIALIANLHQNRHLVETVVKSREVNVKILLKTGHLFKKGPPSCLTPPQRGGGGPHGCEGFTKA
jgi:hypothetical protein